MKLVRFATPTGPQPGVVRDDEIVGLGDLAAHFPSILSIVGGGQAALDAVSDIAVRGPASISLGKARLLAPIERPGKFLAIGLNYGAHVEEAEKAGVAAPKHQLWFNKQTTCISGPFDDISPGVTGKLDYEVELGVVIGPTARYVAEADAPAHVFGYFVSNDVTARDWQFHTPTFTIGKSFDTHGPIGPWIVTTDEIADPHALTLRCYVNGELRQESSTAKMIHNIWQQIAYLSTDHRGALARARLRADVWLRSRCRRSRILCRRPLEIQFPDQPRLWRRRAATPAQPSPPLRSGVPDSLTASTARD